MYKKARDGIIKNFLGIDNRYESPQDSDLILDTENLNVDECSDKIISFLHSRKLLK